MDCVWCYGGTGNAIGNAGLFPEQMASGGNGDVMHVSRMFGYREIADFASKVKLSQQDVSVLPLLFY